MRHTISNTKPLTVRATFLDDTGKPTEVDGDVTWSTSDVSIATVVPNRPDTSVATITPAGPAGDVDIEAVADARIGSGVRRVTTKIELKVTGGEAVGGIITPVIEGHVGGGPTYPSRPTDPGYGVDAPNRPVAPDQPPGRPPSVGGGPIEPPNRPVAPDQPPGGPGRPVAPDQPPSGNRPVAPDQPPGRPPTVGGGPVTPPGRPDNSLPGSQPEPGHPLPPTAEPKSKK